MSQQVLNNHVIRDITNILMQQISKGLIIIDNTFKQVEYMNDTF